MVREPPPFHCPTFPESYIATLDVLPRGRAWPANDQTVGFGFLRWLDGFTARPVTLVGAGAGGQVQLAFGDLSPETVAMFSTGDRVTVSGLGGTTEGNGTFVVDVGYDFLNLRGTSFVHAWTGGGTVVRAASLWPVGYVQAAYYAAFASVRNYLEQRLCALRLEFWCATQSETFDQWMIEYGLPDNCDPFPDLCTKVAAIGGTRCEYYAEVAARAGWSIYCDTINNDCGANAGCAQAGCDIAGGLLGSAILRIVVNLNESPAYVVAVGDLPYAGNFESGFSLGCEPDIDALKCLLDRVVHAHIVIQYVTEGA